MKPVVTNIWELYGVKENPFSTSPILVTGGNIPLDSFVGRTENVERLGKIFGSKGGSRTLVYGDVGVGKTTFVNVVRSFAMKKGFFTSFKEIAVQDEWDPMAFVLNTLSSIYSTLKLLKNCPVSKESLKKLETLLEIGVSDYNIGVSIAGIGGEVGHDRKTTSSLTTITVQSFFQSIISEIVKKTGNDVIIHYNNLELLPEQKFERLFNNLRDFFQTPNVHFVFVGDLTVHSNFQTIPRISSILTDTPLQIETFTLDEIKRILFKRFKALRISDDLNYVIPYTDNALVSLFELWGGNIRNILNSLSTAILELTNEMPVTLDENLLAVTLRSVVEKRYLPNLTPRAKGVLLEMVKHTEITNKSLSEKMKIASSNVSKYIKDLQTAGCVYLRRKNSRDKFWSAEAKIKWMLLKHRDRSQKTLTSFKS